MCVVWYDFVVILGSARIPFPSELSVTVTLRTTLTPTYLPNRRGVVTLPSRNPFPWEQTLTELNFELDDTSLIFFHSTVLAVTLTL